VDHATQHARPGTGEAQGKDLSGEAHPPEHLSSLEPGRLAALSQQRLVGRLQRTIGNHAIGQLLQRELGDRLRGTVVNDSAPTGELDEIQMDVYKKRPLIKKLHAYQQFDFATSEDAHKYGEGAVVKFTEGVKEKAPLPIAKAVKPAKYYRNRKEPENEGKYEGNLKRFGTGNAFKIVPKGAGWENFERYRTPQGTYEFAVLGDIDDRKVFVSNKGHYSMTDGAAVLYAGEVRFSDGVVTWWNNKSGHYEPRAKHAPTAPFPLDKFASWNQNPEKSEKLEKPELKDEKKPQQQAVPVVQQPGATNIVLDDAGFSAWLFVQLTALKRTKKQSNPNAEQLRTLLNDAKNRQLIGAGYSGNLLKEYIKDRLKNQLPDNY